MAVAFDTNVVVRILVGDDPTQTKRAEKIFLEHASGAGVFISLVVFAEVSWVLSAGYGWERETIHHRLTRLVRTRGVIVEALEMVEAALDAYLRAKADFADFLILGRARMEAVSSFVTFDKKLAREVGVTLA